MTTPLLEIEGARKRFGKTTALDDASLALREGEWLGLLGPNGAGKSTLIRSAVGLVRLNEGAVRLMGEPFDPSAPDRGARLAHIGYVPQDLAIYPDLTARENLRAFAALHRVPARLREDRVEWALEFTNLGDRAREPTKRFSGGMKRRLNIACGVLHRPSVVLLDEPTVGVDPQSRERIWEMLGELRAGGASILLTTHQLDEAETVCDRIAIIDHGAVIAEGSMDELVRSTIGAGRRVLLTLDGSAEPGELPGGWSRQNGEVRFEVESVADELPDALERAKQLGLRIEDVRVHRPTLQAVFIHLTGRELRE